jgi:hypothetical protein
VKSLQELVDRKDLRSADRASLRSMLKKLRKGSQLSYQERLNLEAYESRYTKGLRGI